MPFEHAVHMNGKMPKQSSVEAESFIKSNLLAFGEMGPCYSLLELLSISDSDTYRLHAFKSILPLPFMKTRIPPHTKDTWGDLLNSIWPGLLGW